MEPGSWPARRRLALTAVAVVGLLLLATPWARAGDADSGASPDSAASAAARAQVLAQRAQTTPADHDAAVRAKRQLGYLVGDLSRFNALKGQPGATSGSTPPAATITPPPTLGPSWKGVDEDDLAPPDTTGAIGPNSYIEAINLQVAIYNRRGALVAKAPFESLTTGSPKVDHLDLSDPQMMWDSQTQRFYFVVLDVNTDTFYWGFSKTASPTHVGTTGTSADWCSYNADFGYGSNLPDYPKLGQSTNYLMIGANIYAAEVYLGSDIDTISKPGRGPITTCPSPNTFQLGQDAGILDCGANPSPFASDPNPAQEAGSSSTGWVAAIPDATNSGTVGNNLDLFKVTKGRDGLPRFSDPSCVTVPSYSPPPPAPQQGVPFFLDTLDGRLTHAVAAVDPRHGGWAIWTSHTIAGGAGSLARWYEIDPAQTDPAKAVLQTGDVSDPTLFVLNGGISDDWAPSCAATECGSNMVMGVTTTSPSDYPAVQMVSKIGSKSQSALVMVKQSPGPDAGFDCFRNPVYPTKCRWGDYAGATPDPNPPSTTTGVGRVWLTNEWASGDIDPFAATWRTWNWAATP